MTSATTSTGYTYDPLDRLTGFSPGHVSGESLRYEYAGDRVIAAWTMGTPSVRRQAYGYDDQSNLSSISTYDATGASITETVCLVHDALGRLVVAGKGSPSSGGPDALGCRTESAVTEVIARFGYDALNRRVSRTNAAGKTTWFAFLPGGETLGEYEQTGTPSSPWRTVREYVWLDGRPVAQEEHPSDAERYTYAVHVDQIGLPRVLTNSAGQTVWRATGRPYGDVEETTFVDSVSGRTVVTNLRLPGQYDERLLASVGLQGPYYNWNRWYLPSVGRYLELDPIAKAGGFNGFYGPNWYGYAEGNPLRWIDRRGLDETSYGPFGPRNGNWGGWCWSGGQYCVFGNGNGPPLDTGDEAYMRHDQCIAECEGIPGGPVSRSCYVLCDKLTLDELNGLDPDPMKWPRPPKPEFLEDTRKFCEGAKRQFTCTTNPDACRDK